MFQNLFDDDVLNCHLAGDAVGIVEVDHIKDVFLYILPHFVERGAVKPRAGESVINVFLDEHMTGRRNLLFNAST
jgi:hypothetical protein